MAPAHKCLIFSVFADLTNWGYKIDFNRHTGLTSWHVDLTALPMLIAFIALPFLFVRTYRLMRICFDRGVKIPKEKKFIDWRPCLLLYPLVCHIADSAIGFAPDGAMYTRMFSYGTDSSFLTLMASVLLIVLYQFYAALKVASGGDRLGLSKYGWMT